MQFKNKFLLITEKTVKLEMTVNILKLYFRLRSVELKRM